MFRKKIIVYLIVLVFAAAPVGANLVVDGSFEGLIAAAEWVAVAGNGETFGAWIGHPSLGHIWLYEGVEMLPAEGTAQCHMGDGYSAAHITQMVSGFVIGGTYEVSLAAAGYASTTVGASLKITNLATSIDDLDVTFEAPCCIGTIAMEYSSFEFVASNTELELAIFNPDGGYATQVDDVSIKDMGPHVGITESGDSTEVQEGGASDSYEIVLSEEPSANVTITATPADGEIDIGSGAGVAKTLVFTSSDWNTAQTVTVSAFDDTVYEGGPSGGAHITNITHSAQQPGGDSEYDGMSISTVEVSVIDDELGCGDWGYDPADFNLDCYVDLADFAKFALYYLDGV